MRLILVGLAVVLCLFLRIISQPDGYTSPDSHAYLYKAEHLVHHQRGMVTFVNDRLGEHKVPSANWPIGYSFFIRMVHHATGLSYLWSSKVVNFIFSWLVLWVLHLWFRKEAWLVALALFSFSSMEIFSHTWSEGPFLFFVILLAYLIYRDFRHGPSSRRWMELSVILVAIFLLRYAGLIYFLMLGAVILYCLYEKRWRLAKHYTLALAISSMAVGAYMAYNYTVSGALFGGHRLNVSPLSAGELVMIYLDTVAFARILVDRSDVIYYLVSGLQTVLMVWGVYIFYGSKRWKIPPIALPLLGVAVFYFVVISTLKLLITAIDFDYRMFSPFSVVLFMGMLASVPAGDTPQTKWLRRGTVGFTLVSLVVNLPNQFILDWIMGLRG